MMGDQPIILQQLQQEIEMAWSSILQEAIKNTGYPRLPYNSNIICIHQQVNITKFRKLLLRCRLYLVKRSVTSSFHGPLQFREQEKVTGGQIWGIRWLRHH
ncbi:hypothetical protein LAZ67_23001868 [Cordylochernes scorpioides]|uniref:Uncharacterized protein n=1 Tax=Cordylochernes scorpioides TaxID=51811 RepID=A0ABY6LR50_9ARAC|nr:hypothetical protein LAZ67_23001868 [Cordylochernes scorpioides]